MEVFSSFHNKVDNYIETNFNRKGEIACCSGCSYCCEKVMIMAFPDEIDGIVRAINSLNNNQIKMIAKKIAEIDKIWPKSSSEILNNHSLEDLQSFLTAKQATFPNYSCPLLVNNKCIIYDNRPVVCRTYFSSDSRKCKTLNGDLKFFEAYDKTSSIYIDKKTKKTILPFPLFRNIDLKGSSFVNLFKGKWEKAN